MTREGLRKRLRGLFRALLLRAPGPAGHKPDSVEAEREHRLAWAAACAQAEAAIAAVVRETVPEVRLFSLHTPAGTPPVIAVWIVTETDEERDLLRADPALQPKLARLFRATPFPGGARPAPAFAFESEETVARDYGGNWWVIVK